MRRPRLQFERLSGTRQSSRYIVSSEYVANVLRERWFGNVVIDVVPFEGCG